jgi:putative SOS response-associated peptidase YedK
VPDIGDHTLFSIMTTESNGIVEPIHEKAMPVMLMMPEDVEQWLQGSSVKDALEMQKPAPDKRHRHAAAGEEGGLAAWVDLATG